MVEGLTHEMKNMSLKNDQHIPLCMLVPKPGKKDVTEGIKEFRVILRSTGKWDGKVNLFSIEHHGIVLVRLKELIDARDFDAMASHYARASRGMTFKKAHEINILHVEEAIKGIINKNSAEISIKRYKDLKVSAEVGIKRQADEIRRQIG